MRVPHLKYLLSICAIAIGCSTDELGTDPDLNQAPPAPRGLRTTTGNRSIQIEWDFLDAVDPQISFSGYKIYYIRGDEGLEEDIVFATDIEMKPSDEFASSGLIKRVNSFSDDHMDVKLINLSPGLRYAIQVAGVQNGNTGPLSSVVVDIPFRTVSQITIWEEEIRHFSWYLLGRGQNESLDPVETEDRIGFAHDPDTGENFLRFRSIDDGGHLRLLNAGPHAENDDAPVTGWIDDPATDRVSIEDSDYIFIRDTMGTLNNDEDDLYSRVWVRRIFDAVARDLQRIEIDLDYQTRPNSRSL